jgi:hypothetical protein
VGRWTSATAGQIGASLPSRPVQRKQVLLALSQSSSTEHWRRILVRAPVCAVTWIFLPNQQFGCAGLFQKNSRGSVFRLWP